MQHGILRELSLESLVEQGKIMHASPLVQKDGLWAYNACKLSRLILRQVEETWPSTDYVKNDILDAFLRDFPETISKIGEADRGGDWAKYFPDFTKNIRERLIKLDKYVKEPPICT